MIETIAAILLSVWMFFDNSHNDVNNTANIGEETSYDSFEGNITNEPHGYKHMCRKAVINVLSGNASLEDNETVRLFCSIEKECKKAKESIYYDDRQFYKQYCNAKAR